MTPRVIVNAAPWTASEATSFGMLVSRSSASGGSWSSITPQITSNAFLPTKPAIRPLMMLTGMNRIFAIDASLPR